MIQCDNYKEETKTIFFDSLRVNIMNTRIKLYKIQHYKHSRTDHSIY